MFSFGRCIEEHKRFYEIMQKYENVVWRVDIMKIADLNKKNMHLFLILVILISLVPPLTVAIQHREDPFWFIYQIPPVLSNFQEGHIFEINVLGHEIMIMLTSKVLGLSPEDVIFFPIGGFIMPALYYILVKRVFKSHLLAILSVPYITLFMSSGHSYAMSPMGMGLCIFITGLFFYYINVSNRIKKIIPLLLAFVALHFIYYTTEVFLLLFLIYTTMILIFEERVCHKKLQNR